MIRNSIPRGSSLVEHRSSLAVWLRAFACVLLLATASALFAAPLRVGIEIDTEPITFLDARGMPAGFAVDLMNSIAREMNFEVLYFPNTRKGMFDDFSEGRTDALAHAVWTKERDAYMGFAVPHLEFNSTVFTRKGEKSIRSMKDLRGRKVSVMLNTRGHEYLTLHGVGAHFVPVGTQREALQAVADGRADATITAMLMALKIVRDDGLALEPAEILELPDLVYKFHAAFHRHDHARLAVFNEGLARIRANGTYDRIYERWVGPLDPRPLRFKDIQPYLLPTLAVLAAALGLLLWQRRVLRRLARQAEALRRSEERLMLVLEGGDHGLWDRDFATNMVERNERTLAMLGYTSEEMGPQFENWTKFIHPDDLPAFLGIQEALGKSRDNILSAEYRIKAKDGTWRWMNSRGKVLERRADGTPLRAAGTHTDITERKVAEEERASLQRKILETQKLESLGLLAGGIAHDFNNLLTVILGHSSFARLHVNDPMFTQEALAQIETASHRAADLCHQMLAYAGGSTVSKQKIDLNALITELAPLLRSSIGKDSNLKFELTDGLPTIEADPTQLRQIVMNLVINASEALGPGGGTIRVVTAARGPLPAELRDAVHAPEKPVCNPVCLSVSDNGCGMSPETRAKIFEPFFTTKFTGRGLGLASVIGIVRAHHSLFCLHSQPGEGSTFTMFIPAAEGVAPLHAPPAEAVPTAGQRGKILLADDEPALISAIAPMLRRQGYEVVIAVDGREAVDKFTAAPGTFLAVVLDFTMPRLNGIGALEAIRLLRPEIPAMIMSGFGAADALSRLPADKRPVFLQKPFTHADLIARLGSALARPHAEEKRDS
jgi:PAS domain S-box-containing protein